MVSVGEQTIDGLESAAAAARTGLGLVCDVGVMETVIGMADHPIDGLSEYRTVRGCLIFS